MKTVFVNNQTKLESIIVNEQGLHEGGRIMCRICGSQGGMKISKYRGGNDHKKWSNRNTCLKCKSTERVSCFGNNVLDQKINTIF